MAKLTEEQIDQIVETWKIPTENYFDSGEHILYKFLERHQNYQAHFRRFKYTPLEELKGKPGFRDHASKIMNRISATIDCLQTEGGVPEIRMIWDEIGTSHNKRKIPRQAFLVSFLNGIFARFELSILWRVYI